MGRGFYTPLDAKNQRWFTAWLLLAALAYLGATAALRWQALVPPVLPWLATGLAVALALQATRSYLTFLRGTDELLRKIQTDALALGFGCGLIFCQLYPLFERLGAPRLGASATGVVMMVVWSLGAWRGARRYGGGCGP